MNARTCTHTLKHQAGMIDKLPKVTWSSQSSGLQTPKNITMHDYR